MRRPGRTISDDEWLTQYGNKRNPIGGRPFKNRPPYPDDCNALSLIRGQRSVAAAASLVRTSRNTVSRGSGVRYTIAARLRQAGFTLRLTGNNYNPHHVSVTCIDEKHIWTEDDCVRFDACFDKPAWKEG
jgi:hypothetical protein